VLVRGERLWEVRTTVRTADATAAEAWLAAAKARAAKELAEAEAEARKDPHLRAYLASLKGLKPQLAQEGPVVTIRGPIVFDANVFAFLESRVRRM
jgi:hypothetical protein